MCCVEIGKIYRWYSSFFNHISDTTDNQLFHPHMKLPGNVQPPFHHGLRPGPSGLAEFLQLETHPMVLMVQYLQRHLKFLGTTPGEVMDMHF